MSGSVNQSQFSRLIGQSRQQVSKLKAAGRLVMDGKLIKVVESVELIAATAGARGDVAERHAQERMAQKNDADMPLPMPEEKNAPDAILEGELTLKEVGMRIKLAEMRDKEASSQIREMEAAQKAGDLIAREDVDAAMKFIGATVRGLLDVLPDQVSPVIAPVTSMDECHALLTEHCRNVLVGLGEAIERQRASVGGGDGA